MKYVIFFTLVAALSRNSEITRQCNFDDGITNNYADVIKYPNVDSAYALPIVNGYEKYFTKQELDSAKELSNDWFVVNTLK